MHNLNIKKAGNVFGIISSVFFVLCMVWSVVIVDPALRSLHSDILRIVYPGSGFDFVGLTIGVIEAFIYGWIFGASFSWLCKKVCVSGEDK